MRSESIFRSFSRSGPCYGEMQTVSPACWCIMNSFLMVFCQNTVGLMLLLDTVGIDVNNINEGNSAGKYALA